MADRQYEAGPFGDGDEGGRGEQAARRVVPPDQRLEPDNAPGGELDLRLVVELELAAVQRHPQLLGDPHALMNFTVEVVAVEAEAVAALVLGAVKRQIGLHHHRLGTGGFGREQGDADARGDADLVALDAERHGQKLADPGGKFPGGLRIGDCRQQNGELVAAEPRHQVLGPDRGLQPANDLLQQQVAHGVAERVVHILEVVDVEIEHGEGRRAAQARGEGHGEPLEEGAAIGQAGQKIGLGEFQHPGIGGLEPKGMAHRGPHIGEQRAKHQKDGRKHEPGPVVADQPALHRHDDQVPPGIAGSQHGGPGWQTGQSLLRLALKRLLATGGATHIDRHRVGARMGRIEIKVDVLRQRRAREDTVEHRCDLERTDDHAPRISASLVDAVQLGIMAIDRNQGDEALALPTDRIAKLNALGRRHDIALARAADRLGADGLGIEIGAQRGRPFGGDGRIENGKVLIALGRHRHRI